MVNLRDIAGNAEEEEEEESTLFSENVTSCFPCLVNSGTVKAKESGVMCISYATGYSYGPLKQRAWPYGGPYSLIRVFPGYSSV